MNPTLRSPHTRGDGPNTTTGFATINWFSPHAWGWSEKAKPDAEGHLVLPTRVGMVRLLFERDYFHVRSPHTRGDGPQAYHGSQLLVMFSPHAWGWSALDRDRSCTAVVLPTRVGMVRSPPDYLDA